MWDATTNSYVCTTCGFVLEGVLPRHHSQERHRLEVIGRTPNEPRNAWLNRQVVETGSVIMIKDFRKLRPCQHELFLRLYHAHLNSIRSFQDDLRKSAFDRFLHRLTKYPAFCAAFPPDPKHQKTIKLLDTFLAVCRQYAARYGRQKLHNPTKIRIFLALIQPHLDSKSFQDIVTRVAETTMAAVYGITKKIALYAESDHRSVNVNRKQEFIGHAKNLVNAAAINSQIKELANEILTKRARLRGLIPCKRPAILAAAALFVAATHHAPKTRHSQKKRIQQLVGASYISHGAIVECQKILAMDNEQFVRMEQQEVLVTCLQQRDALLERRHSLRRQLVGETKKAFPEFSEILKLRNVSTLKFLEQYPSTVKIAKLELNKLTDFLKKHSRGKLRNVDKLAGHLLTEARKNETVGRHRPRPGNQTTIHSLVKALEKIEKQRLEFERQMLNIIGEEGRTLMRTHGIGLITATIMLLAKGSPMPYRIVGQTFFHSQLQDAIRVIKRNHPLYHQFQELFEQNKPSMETIQLVTDQLLQTPIGPVPS